MKTIKAIVLFSGGLDSILAAKIIKLQGVEVVGAHFKSLFLPEAKKAVKPLDAAAMVGIDLCQIDITQEMLDIIALPQHGFGSRLNPCIDCRILMLKKAGELLGPQGADFVVTGEVLGQRPMSQRRDVFDVLDKQSGLEGLVLRPLSALLLKETVPEKQGWVRRRELFAINGRERKPQIELAAKFGISRYPNAAGGCLLTDLGFCRRMNDLMRYGKLTREDVGLLRLGRHFRLDKSAKLIVGRDERENNILLSSAGKQDYLFYPADDIAGPTCLGRGDFRRESVSRACNIAAKYCDLNDRKRAVILVKNFSLRIETAIKSSPMSEAELRGLKI